MYRLSVNSLKLQFSAYVIYNLFYILKLGISFTQEL